MSCPNPTGRVRTTAEADRIAQHAVLTEVIALHPVQVSSAELVSHIARDPEDFGERDAVERAIRDLARVRLLRSCGRCDPLILPTRAALIAHDLLLQEGGENGHLA